MPEAVHIATNETTITMEELLARAEKEGLWFCSTYLHVWFSPQELLACQAKGQFSWDADLFHLRDPQELLREAERDLSKAQERYDSIKARIEREA